MTAKALVISNICCGLTKKICMLVNGFQDTGQNQKELNVLMWCLTRLQKIDSVISSQGPVIVLTGTIQACKRFLVKQTAHAVTACHLFQDTHHDLVVICCNINRCIDWRKLMLCRCNLIVLGLGCNSQLPALFIYFFHICGNSLTDGSEIMVIHLLSFRRHGSEKSASGVNQILSLHIFLFINKEILLLCTNRWCHSPGGRISEKSEKS